MDGLAPEVTDAKYRGEVETDEGRTFAGNHLFLLYQVLELQLLVI